VPGTAASRRAPPLLGAALALLLDAALLAVGVGGARALLHHPRALALLAVWAAGAFALARARPPRAGDPRERRAEARVVLAILVLVPLLTPMLSAWSERAGVWPLPGGAALHWAGVALAAAGLGLRVVAMRRLGARFSPLIEVQRQHALETGGVYAWMRHPGYAGGCLANLGAVLAFGSGATLPLAAVMLLATTVRARREEQTLEAAFGDEYRRYRREVGFAWRGRAAQAPPGRRP
jgi:protein-S-isoprenylcysteine O-methyltransferase Ste14